ncbi:preprotein translocase subunit YajC [Hoyosella rhizosphaerae]|uniref:Preprotein translocase subunit YajC n=1 Tax=Hoyosella rhizosphaerae TaxID=1755582 RepID=A0A916XBH3_9ACTN|nr:preprotein translocase subunit YajC [Hoyosella rhizosphaerae]MBN4926420.1 preprotein translocase subunit YajC [Hoyosella rhizosphaerae]GGC59490.1 hypothetical protein GCM10011410_09920 [Hoyosella rhizosphaerae]
MEWLLPLLILLLLVPLFLSVRRQKREMDRQTALQDSLKVGDRIMTTSGLYGTVLGLQDTTIDLEIAPGVAATWLRMAVRDIVTEDPNSPATEQDWTTEATFDPNDGFDQRGNESGRQ